MSLLFLDFIQELGLSNQVRSGILHVPENHSYQHEKKIQIAFLIIKSLKKRSKKHPLIYISGGPGGQSITKSRIKIWFNNAIRKDRDVILFDQRGVGFSSPLPNMKSDVFRHMFQNVSLEEEQRYFEKSILQYEKFCQIEGINISNYNSIQIANDVLFLMKHLGYKKYNLYAVSSGTRIARILQDSYSEYLHTVTHNSPTLLEGDFLKDRLQNFSSALEKVFSFCERNQTGNEVLPDLRNLFLETIISLKETPIELTVDGTRYLINSRDALYLVKRQLHANDARQKIPMLIEALKHRKGKILKEILLAEISFMKYINLTTFLVVERAEMFDQNFTTKEAEQKYQLLPLLPTKMGFFHSFYFAGKKMLKSEFSFGKKQLKRSEVPTLITVNYYDPITTPDDAKKIQEQLSNAHLFVLDEAGHGHGDFTCRTKIMKAFMDKPEKKIDVSCLKIYFSPQS